MPEKAAHCDLCGDLLPSYGGKGRPRKRCKRCADDKSVLGKAWREANRERVNAFNDARRLAWHASREWQRTRREKDDE